MGTPENAPEPSRQGILKRGMTPTHELMGEWILQNPGGTLAQMGAFFGYSISWLSQVINSDMFRAYMKDRLGNVQAVVQQDVPAKMAVLAHVACDRMLEVLQSSGDPEIIKDGFDKVMHRYGYAPNAKTGLHPQGPAIGTQNNVFYLNREQFAEVQSGFVHSHAPRLSFPQPEPAKEDDRTDVPQSIEKV